jgi:hypothetical protein
MSNSLADFTADFDESDLLDRPFTAKGLSEFKRLAFAKHLR